MPAIYLNHSIFYNTHLIFSHTIAIMTRIKDLTNYKFRPTFIAIGA